MAVKALVLVEVAGGKIDEVAQAIRKTKGVQSVDVVTGPYDLAIMVEAADVGVVGALITKNIHAIPHLSKTTTCVVVKSF